MISQESLFQSLTTSFAHTPTPSQSVALKLISEYLLSENASEKLFLLKGFAGTGKTAITNCIIQCLPLIQHYAILLAPTGRAAKVMSAFTKKQAFTIHKYIYYHKNNTKDLIFTLRKNKSQNTLFIVDEASMIADNDAVFGSRSLLNDLIQFVYEGNNCKLLLIGDEAQLPPVHTTLSPALNPEYLSYNFHKEVITTTLTEVVRQRSRSAILRNATALRKIIFSNTHHNTFAFKLRNSPDLVQLSSGYEVQEAISEAYDNYGSEETTLIVRANKRAVDWNTQIRRSILDAQDEVEAGDLLMVVKNNYYWLKDNPALNFIANGDTIEIINIHHIREYYGFRFAEISAQLVDYPTIPPFDTVIILDTLYSDAAALTPTQNQELYQSVLDEYANEPTLYSRYQKLKEDPYYNALQVKFSYAITCHKSQGGQWEAVFIEKPYLPPDYVIDQSYYRWLYTALTRAKQQVFLIGFNDDDFAY